MKAGIRSRVLLASIMPAAMVALLLGSGFLGIRLDDLDATLRMRAWTLARQVAATADYGVFSGNRASLRDLAEDALRRTGAQAIVVVDAGGRVLAEAGRSELAAPPAFDGREREFIDEAARVSVVVLPVTLARVDMDDFDSEGAVAIPTPPAAIGHVVVEMSRQALFDEKRSLLLGGLAISMGGMILGALLGLRISRGVTRPILHISDVVERIGQGDLAARVRPDPDHALDRLEQGLNSMAERIETAHDQLAEKIKEATAELRRSEERLLLVISGTSDGIWDWDLQRNAVYFSRRFQELLGYQDRDEFQQEFFFFSAALHPDDADHVLEAQAEHLRSGAPYDVEFRLRCKEGAYRWFRGRGQALWDEFGEPTRFAGSITDITAQKSAEELLMRRKEEAEQATLARTRFLAAASHDLRQPMHALGMFVSRLARQKHSPENTDLIAHIESSVYALQDLLDALLDISKLDAGVLKPSVRPFAVDGLLTRLEGEFAGSAAEKGVRLKRHPSDLWLAGDPVLIERIVMNLVSNAVRYTHRGGILIACRRRGSHGRIEVRDSGIGIPESAQQEIFKEFVQLDNPERDRGKGLGLGLAICARLARLLGHWIGLRSAPGRGSVFWIDVPLAEAAEAEAPPAPAPLPGALPEGLVVALIDDDDNARMATQGTLADWGCQVLACGSGRELIGLCDAEGLRPQIVVCDYRLRDGESGVTVAGELRSRYGRDLPIILVSGNTDPALILEAVAHGLPLLHKPVRPAKLRTLLQRLLAPQRPA